MGRRTRRSRDSHRGLRCRALSNGDSRRARSLTSLIIHPFYRSEKVGARSYPGGKHCATYQPLRRYGNTVRILVSTAGGKRAPIPPCRVSLRSLTGVKSDDLIPAIHATISQFTCPHKILRNILIIDYLDFCLFFKFILNNFALQENIHGFRLHRSVRDDELWYAYVRVDGSTSDRICSAGLLDRS